MNLNVFNNLSKYNTNFITCKNFFPTQSLIIFKNTSLFIPKSKNNLSFFAKRKYVEKNSKIFLSYLCLKNFVYTKKKEKKKDLKYKFLNYSKNNLKIYISKLKNLVKILNFSDRIIVYNSIKFLQNVKFLILFKNKSKKKFKFLLNFKKFNLLFKELYLKKKHKIFLNTYGLNNFGLRNFDFLRKRFLIKKYRRINRYKSKGYFNKKRRLKKKN